MKKIIMIGFCLFAFANISNAAYQEIINGESGLSVRTKMNQMHNELYTGILSNQTDLQTALGLKLDVNGAQNLITTGTLTTAEIIIPFVDNEAGVIWDSPNTSFTPTAGTYGIVPEADGLKQIVNGVKSAIGASVVEVATAPDPWDLTPGEITIAQDTGTEYYLLKDSSVMYTRLADTSTALSSLTLGVVSDGSITINGTAYTSSGSPHTITNLAGAITITALYSGDNNELVWSGADSGDVSGTYPTYSITMSAATTKSIVGTFSVGATEISQYRFEDGALTVDSVGTNTLTNTGVTANTTLFKEGAASASFDGVAAKEEIIDSALDSGHPLKSDSTPGDFTIAFWFRAGSAGIDVFLLGKYDISGDLRSIGIRYLGGSDTLNFSIGHTSGTAFETSDSTITLSELQWYHVGITYTDSTRAYKIRVYDDVAGDNLANITGNFVNNMSLTTAPLEIGARDSSGFFSGLLDDMRIFNSALSDVEIDALR